MILELAALASALSVIYSDTTFPRQVPVFAVLPCLLALSAIAAIFEAGSYEI